MKVIAATHGSECMALTVKGTEGQTCKLEKVLHRRAMAETAAPPGTVTNGGAGVEGSGGAGVVVTPMRQPHAPLMISPNPAACPQPI
jgi:hypothetical protein